MSFRFYTQNLRPQVRAIINERDENNRILRESSENSLKKESNNAIYPLAIFMKLTFDSSSKYNGLQIMQKYEDFCKSNSSTWFSTDSLSRCMSKAKRAEFVNAINNKYIVEMYFVVGKSGGSNNDIKYKAEVLDIRTNANKMSSPDKTLTPNEWKNDKNKIWIKIKNIKKTTNLSSKDFIVASTKNVLANSIAHSEHHFGYIKKNN